MRLASAEAKSSENDCPRPCVCRVVPFPTAHPPTPPQFPFPVCSQDVGTHGCLWIQIQACSPESVSVVLLLAVPCSASGGKLWSHCSQLLILQCRDWLGLHSGHCPADWCFWRSRSKVWLFCSSLEPFYAPALVCSSSGLVPECHLWHLQLGEEIAHPKTQCIYGPVLKLSTLKMCPVLFCLLLLFTLA